jgi:hypothetical protein
MPRSKSILGTAILANVILLADCGPPSPPMGWTREGSTYQDYTAERYQCIQAAQQRISGAEVNAYGGASSSGVYPSLGMYMACMQAQGWSYVPNGFTGATVNFVP